MACCDRCRNLTTKGFSRFFCKCDETQTPIPPEALQNEIDCACFNSRYIEYPITVTGITNVFEQDTSYSLYKCGQLVKVRPCGEEHKDRTYAGILLGELPFNARVSYDRDSGKLTVGAVCNPAIYVPELSKIVYGMESWWQRVNSVEEAMEDLTDNDINSCWYVQLLRTMTSSEEKGGSDN